MHDSFLVCVGVLCVFSVATSGIPAAALILLFVLLSSWPPLPVLDQLLIHGEIAQMLIKAVQEIPHISKFILSVCQEEGRASERK